MADTSGAVSASRSVRRFYVPPMIISPLANIPDAIQTLAKWFYDEWHAFDGRSIEFIALSRGIGPLYLWTPGSTQLYEHCGWIEFASATYASRPIKLMHFPK